MAKKSRTPPPPRRVQAPQRRQGQPGRDAEQRKRLLLILFGASGIVALGVVIAVIVLTGGSKSSGATATTGGLGGSEKVAAAMRAAGCTYFDKAGPKPPKGESQHIATLADKVDWNTYPPAGGQHYPQWAVWGFYTDPVNPKQVVHNEEHGAMVLWWGPSAPKSEVDRMQVFYQSSPNSMFGTPLGTINGQSLGSKVAFTAFTGSPDTYQRKDWGFEHVAVCPTFDEHAATVFRDAYRGHGPEGTPTSANNPGEGP